MIAQLVVAKRGEITARALRVARRLPGDAAAREKRTSIDSRPDAGAPAGPSR